MVLNLESGQQSSPSLWSSKNYFWNYKIYNQSISYLCKHSANTDIHTRREDHDEHTISRIIIIGPGLWLDLLHLDHVHLTLQRVLMSWSVLSKILRFAKIQFDATISRCQLCFLAHPRQPSTKTTSPASPINSPLWHASSPWQSSDSVRETVYWSATLQTTTTTIIQYDIIALDEKATCS